MAPQHAQFLNMPNKCETIRLEIYFDRIERICKRYWQKAVINVKRYTTIVVIYKCTKLQKYGYISTNTSHSALIMLSLVSGVRDHLPFLHSHVQLAGVSRANRMPWTMVAIDGRKKGIYNKTAKMVSANGSSPKISSRRTEDTSSLGATHFFIFFFFNWDTHITYNAN